MMMQSGFNFQCLQEFSQYSNSKEKKILASISKIKTKLASSIHSHNTLNISLLFNYLVAEMDKANCSKGTFFEKELLNPFQVNESFL